MRYGVTILGAGPAASATALSLKRLRPSLHVLVVEAPSREQWRVGETLSPGCQTILQHLGCWDSFRTERFLECFGTTSAWGSDDPQDNEFIFSLGGNGWHVDRMRFDRMLSDCSREVGTQVWSGFRTTQSELIADDGWRLTLCGAAGNKEVESRFVVDATGRSASFAVQQGAQRLAWDRLIGVFVRFRFSSDTAPTDPRTLVEAEEDGWWYSALTPDCCMVVAWMSDADLIRARALQVGANWMDHLDRSKLTKARLVHGRPELPPRLQAAQSQTLTKTSGPGWLATGDAANTLDPLSSQGIRKALQTGKLAAFVALDCLAGRPAAQARYDALLARDYQHYNETKSWFYALEKRWPQSPFWSRRHRPWRQPETVYASL